MIINSDSYLIELIQKSRICNTSCYMYNTVMYIAEVFEANLVQRILQVKRAKTFSYHMLCLKSHSWTVVHSVFGNYDISIHTSYIRTRT